MSRARVALFFFAVLGGFTGPSGPSVAAEPLGGPVLAATPRNSVGSPLAFPENLRRDIALQDDGSVWVVDPASRFVTGFGPGLGGRFTLEMVATVAVAAVEAPFRGVVGICAVPGSPSGDNQILIREPGPAANASPLIATVRRIEHRLEVVGPFREVSGLPPGAFLTGLDRHPTEPELLTLDEENRQAIRLDANFQVLSRSDLLGEGNPLSARGIAYLDAETWTAGACFGRPFSLQLALAYRRSDGRYLSEVVPLDAAPGRLAGGFDAGLFAGEPAVYLYDVPHDSVVAVRVRRVAAPPPPRFQLDPPGPGGERKLTIEIDALSPADEIVVRENGVTVGLLAPGESFILPPPAGTAQIELEAQAGGVPNPIRVPFHLFNGGWPPGESPHQRFANIPFDPASGDFIPGDALTGLALDWRGTRPESRLYLASFLSPSIRILTGDGEPAGSFNHRYAGAGITGLALAKERDTDGSPQLVLLDADGLAPPEGDGRPRWAKIDTTGRVIAQGTIDTSLLEPTGRGRVDFGDWDDDGQGGYIVHDGASGRICRIDGSSFFVAGVSAPLSEISGDPSASSGPGGALSVAPNGSIRLVGVPSSDSEIVTDAILFTAWSPGSGSVPTGFSLAVPDLSLFNIRFCEGRPEQACPPRGMNLPGIGFQAIRGFETGFEPVTGHELAYSITPDALLFSFFDGREESGFGIATQGLLTRTGARTDPALDARQLVDAVLELLPGATVLAADEPPPFPEEPEVSHAVLLKNLSAERDLRARLRILVDGRGESPLLAEDVSIEPKRLWRREVRLSGKARLSLEIQETGQEGGRARVIVGALGKKASATLLRRGDMDASGTTDLTDAVVLLEHLFLGGAPPPCPDAADADDSGRLDITDPVILLEHLFKGGPPPEPPGLASCGQDPSPDLLDACVFPPCR